MQQIWCSEENWMHLNTTHLSALCFVLPKKHCQMLRACKQQALSQLGMLITVMPLHLRSQNSKTVFRQVCGVEGHVVC